MSPPETTAFPPEKMTRADTPVCPYGGYERVAASLPKVMQWFKTMSANAYIRGMRENRWPVLSGRLWQRNYYDHIIRDDDDLNRVREYIIDNPVNWHKDEENPDRLGKT
ncbi:MAG: transposase [Alphaproteobacteria bacterium]